MAENGSQDHTAIPAQGWLRPLAALDGLIARLEAAVLAAGVILMAVLSVANVIGRFVFGQSIFFAEELNQFLVVLITFFGIGYAARQGRHIRMTAFYDAMPDRARKWLMVVIALITAAAMFVLAWYALAYVQSVLDTGRVAPALRVPVWVTLVWAPVGFVVTGIQYVMTAVVNLTRPEVYVSSSVIDSYDDSPTEV
ncbi:TRAP transporter small permease [Limibaculum sp. M0105]|uniref:TRAP transporter small permease protein n=1 Tax=Thermohalobaculum xanthum TaxID=2753746 RepID=A0A8J7M8S5_9RHOB|nr:TRAP transporter small permease [Thermohalobaculum xanthum]MBK0400416.1 TRAP transporter small permease [Thermohalobaculum xanthum]